MAMLCAPKHALEQGPQTQALLLGHLCEMTPHDCWLWTQAFQKKYNMIAAYCPDTAFLEVTGDETKDTRKMMMEMAVKATPAFRCV